MTHICRFERSQLLLLPEAIDDYVGADKSVRFVDAFVDGLDLKAAGFERVEAKATGRMEITLSGGEKIVVGADVERAALARAIKAAAMNPFSTDARLWLLTGQTATTPSFSTAPKISVRW
jgi:hypothetical protein